MQENDMLWDRFAGALAVYVENYLLKSGDEGSFGLKPSYEVDYEIADEIIDFLQKTLETSGIENRWSFQIAACKNINELAPQLKQLAVQFLPKFLKQYPQYAQARCLEVEK